MKPRICVLSQSLNIYSGGETSVCAWIIEALKKDFRITLASLDRDVNTEHINHLYGTTLVKEDIEMLHTPLPQWLERIPSEKLKSLRLAYMVRAFKSLCGDFEIVINTLNEISLPFSAVQYIHCPIRHYRTIKDLYTPPERWLRLVNDMLFKLVSGSYADNLDDGSVFVANSNWTAKAFEKAYGISARVMYPPIALTEKNGNEKIYENREIGFVTIGRLSPEKRLHEAIHIIDQVHKAVPEVRLHLIGLGTEGYANRIDKMAEERGYVTVHKDLSREELSCMLRKHRFGLHTTRNEHFGMAPAEMVLAGAIVFVHNSGGQVETVDSANELIYEDATEATEKILRVIKDEALQKDLSTRLERMESLYSTKIFVKEINCLVWDTLKHRGSVPVS